MGRCSMRCAFPWTTTAILPGKPPAPVYTLDDNDKDTAWTDATVGTKLTFQFPKKLPKELNGTPFYGFDIADGDIKTDSSFKEYGWVKKVRLFYNGRAFADIALADTRRWQEVTFDDIMASQGDIISLQILELSRHQIPDRRHHGTHSPGGTLRYFSGSRSRITARCSNPAMQGTVPTLWPARSTTPRSFMMPPPSCKPSHSVWKRYCASQPGFQRQLRTRRLRLQPRPRQPCRHFKRPIRRPTLPRPYQSARPVNISLGYVYAYIMYGPEKRLHDLLFRRIPAL